MLKQPVTQVRLTNVAVIRLKTRGKRFEIACYKNKILNWRSGAERDISQVLQTESIFTNVSKGELARVEDLQRVFQTKDSLAIAKLILEKGDLQVSDKEREVALQNTFKDVCSLVAPRIFNRETGLPVPANMVEQLLRNDIKFAVAHDIPVKRQAIKATVELCRAFPDQICRTQLGLSLIVLENQLQQVKSFLADEAFALVTRIKTLNADKESSKKVDVTTTDTVVSGDNAATNERVDNEGGSGERDKATSSAEEISEELPRQNAAQCGSDRQVRIDLFCNPSFFRAISKFIQEDIFPVGTVEITHTNQCIINPLDMSYTEPKDAEEPDLGVTVPQDSKEKRSKNSKETRRKKSADTADTALQGKQLQSSNKTEETTKTSINQSRAAPGTYCRTCEAEIDSIDAVLNGSSYRVHCKSDWHQFNVKRKFKQLSPISLEDYDALSEDLAHGFLAVDI